MLVSAGARLSRAWNNAPAVSISKCDRHLGLSEGLFGLNHQLMPDPKMARDENVEAKIPEPDSANSASKPVLN